MAFKNAQQSRILAGSLHYSGYTTKMNLGFTVGMGRTTTLIDTAEQYIPLQDGSQFGLDLILDTDTTAGGEWSNATAWKSAPAIVTYAPSGLTTGSECFMLQGLETSFSQKSAPNAVVTASIAGLTNGATDAGTVVENLTVVTVTGNGTARDGGAASSNGGIAFLHVTAFTGVTNDIVTIEHSVDGSTAWATLVTFATITGLTSEAVVVAPATTVRRYLRVVDTVTGTPTLTRAVAFARR